MSNVGQRESATQNRIVQFFQSQLGYRYLGNWQYGRDNKNIEASMLSDWLQKRGVSEALINRAMYQLDKAASLGGGKKLYYANKEVYQLLRYGVKDKEGTGCLNETVWLIDWKNPEANDFAIAEEVSIQGENKKRPDIVLYVNGIALGVLELKRSSVSVSEGIRQNLDNQGKNFIRNFFTTMQLVMAGNDTQGLRYGTIETTEKYYLEWKENADNAYAYKLDFHLSLICNKTRFLQIIHDFMVFDAGIKKTCRHNQFFGVEAAKQHILRREGGIIWHTQGSGKSLTMVWLAKWIRENIENSRVLIVTDRTELDGQIEDIFAGVEEEIHRSESSADLLATLHQPNPWLICSLIHKFGQASEDDEEAIAAATDCFIKELKQSLPGKFKAQGELFVFVDECHRTQSGKLHDAMQTLLPDAMFIGFTGTPLMKKDKKASVEVFGGFIHCYKFDEAVADGVILDLRYEARKIDQHISSQKKVDEWFEARTRGLSPAAKMRLKQKWGTMQKVYSSQPRIRQIVNDILMDMQVRPRLMDGHGNAILVCDSVYQACQAYEMFSGSDLEGKVAIVTSYKPVAATIKGEKTGSGLTEALFKYKTYRKMLADFFETPEDKAGSLVEAFETEVKKRFVKEPGQLKLLIVVDKLLTGFDAPPATYLYIDKPMGDHSLFQVICRVNRLDSDDKEYGYIIDYRDLFRSLDKAISDYTQAAFEGYDKEDVAGLLKNRLTQARFDLDNALEMVHALCEPVRAPRNTVDYIHYFCGESGNHHNNDLSIQEALRLRLYQYVAKLLRAYANIANEMTDAGYTEKEISQISDEVRYFEKVKDEVKLASGDFVEMKSYEPAMRQLLNMYVQAENSEVLMDFKELGLMKLIVKKGADAIRELPENIRRDPEAMAETVENNVRKTIIDENPVNPKYYEQMSVLLEELIQLRRQKIIEYKEYLIQICDLARKVIHPEETTAQYPSSMDTFAKRALYDNFGKDELLVTKIDSVIRFTKKADWVTDGLKEREIANAIRKEIAGYDLDIQTVLELAKQQKEYH